MVSTTRPHGYTDLDERDTLPAVIAKRAERTPDAMFIIDISNDRSLTYGEAHELYLTWAEAFRRAGVEPGDRVGVMMPNSLETGAAWLGCGWARAYEVPLNNAYRGQMHRLIEPRHRTLLSCGAICRGRPAGRPAP